MDINQLIFKYGVYYPIVMLRRENVYSYMRFFQQSQYFSRERLQQLQLYKLNLLLSHARKTTEHYRRVPAKVKMLSELEQIPTTHKDDVRESPAEFLSKHQPVFCRNKTSGGSTGAPVTIRKNSKSMAQEMAATWRGYSWANIGIGDRQARFWGVPDQKLKYFQSRLIDFVSNRRRISAFGFSNAELSKFYIELKRFRPAYLYGYVSMIKEFAEYLRDHDEHALRPRAIITTSEMLTKADRKFIEEFFHARVYNEYGCGEIGTIAHECEAGRLHVNSENIIIEVLDTAGKPVSPGSNGEIVVTELNNTAMPLIRYRLKDFGSLDPEICVCGRNLPVITKIRGREYDIIMNRFGEKFHGEFFVYIFEDLKRKGVTVRGFQFIQESKGAMKILVKAASSDMGFIRLFVTDRLKSKFDEDIQVQIELVDRIKRESSGKLRLVKRID